MTYLFLLISQSFVAGGVFAQEIQYEIPRTHPEAELLPIDVQFLQKATQQKLTEAFDLQSNKKVNLGYTGFQPVLEKELQWSDSLFLPSHADKNISFIQIGGHEVFPGQAKFISGSFVTKRGYIKELASIENRVAETEDEHEEVLYRVFGFYRGILPSQLRYIHACDHHSKENAWEHWTREGNKKPIEQATNEKQDLFVFYSAFSFQDTSKKAEWGHSFIPGQEAWIYPLEYSEDIIPLFPTEDCRISPDRYRVERVTLTSDGKEEIEVKDFKLKEGQARQLVWSTE